MEVNQVGVKGYVLFKKCGANRRRVAHGHDLSNGLNKHPSSRHGRETTENLVAVVNHTLKEGVE